MAQFASDAFTGTEGTELAAYSASWTKVTGVTGSAEIASNKLRASSTTSPAYYHSGSPAGADYSVTADVYIPSGGPNSGAAGVLGRCSTSANTKYHARYNALDGGLQLYKVVSGTFTQLGTTSSVSLVFDTSYQIKLEMIGSAIKLYWNGSGSASISQTDSAISAAGRAGVRFFNSFSPSDTLSPQLDNFSADDIGGAATYAPPPMRASLRQQHLMVR